jgi:hypothetical protein
MGRAFGSLDLRTEKVRGPRKIEHGRCSPTLLDRFPQAFAGDDRGRSLRTFGRACALDGYRVIRDALRDTGKAAIGQVVINTRERIVAIRP